MPPLVRWHAWDYTYIHAKDFCSKDAVCPSRNKQVLSVIPLLTGPRIFLFLLSQLESQSLGDIETVISEYEGALSLPL